MNPGPRHPVGSLKALDFVVALQCQRHLVQPLQQAFAPSRIDLETVPLSRRRDDRLCFQIDRDPPCPLRRLDLRGKSIDDRLVDRDGQDAILKTVGEEDIAKTRADHGADAHLLQRPHRALARGAAAEIRARHQDFRLAVRLAIQDKCGIFRSVGQIAERAERPFAKRAADVVSDQTFDADNDVGIDVASHDRRGDRGQLIERLWHAQRPMVRTSVMAPAIAAAAALAGLARWVRARGPCRPTKLRFDVETERSPGATVSPLAARHIEQPGSRHSNPASVKSLSSPSATASRLTVSEPGTTQARTPGATLRPRATSAAARRSLRRLLVHEPMKTQSTGVPAIGAPGFSPI